MNYKFTFIVIFLALIVSLTGCSKSPFKKVDMRERPVNAQERARQNVEQGKGVSINKVLRGRGNTNFQFSSSNPLWRASLEILDFLPMTTVDYAGGMIISDWYSDNTNNSNESNNNWSAHQSSGCRVSVQETISQNLSKMSE